MSAVNDPSVQRSAIVRTQQLDAYCSRDGSKHDFKSLKFELFGYLASFGP